MLENRKTTVETMRHGLGAWLFLLSVMQLNAAELKVFPLFGDHGILQQDTRVAVWGTADPKAHVKVSFRGAVDEVTVDDAGRWIAHLKTPKAVAEQDGTDLEISSGTAGIVLHDVVVGEVWLGTGQSNMDSSMGGYQVGRDDAAHANNPAIRFYSGGGCGHRGDFSRYVWNRCTPQSALNASATGYYICRELQKELNVPVGFVNMAFSGAPLCWFVLPDWFRQDLRTKALFEKFEKQDYPALIARRKEDLANWEKAAVEAKAQGKPEPGRPFSADEKPEVPMECYLGRFYFTHIAPVQNYAFRGIAWDQGEGWVGAVSYNYSACFEIMISNWRKGFGVDLPVVYCQMPKGGAWGPTVCVVDKKTNELAEKVPLAALPAEAPSPGDVFTGFANETDHFSRMLTIPGCFMAVSCDLNAWIHPPDKNSYGHRFAITALNRVYGKPVECFSVLMKTAKREEDSVRVSFDHVGSGLVALGGKELQGFVVSGNLKGSGQVKAVWPKCRLDGNTVVLTAPELDKIDLVSYAPPNGRVMWANLFNKEQLPAYPMTIKVE